MVGRRRTQVRHRRPRPRPAPGPVEPRWRAWEVGGQTGGGPVVSTRLPTEAGVQSRLFPKTRSWFALGAPLELMSPLSIMRVLFALEALVWLGAALSWRHSGGAGTLAAGLGALALWLALLKVRGLDERESAVLATAAIGDAAVMLWPRARRGLHFCLCGPGRAGHCHGRVDSCGAASSPPSKS